MHPPCFRFNRGMLKSASPLSCFKLLGEDEVSCGGLLYQPNPDGPLSHFKRLRCFQPES